MDDTWERKPGARDGKPQGYTRRHAANSVATHSHEAMLRVVRPPDGDEGAGEEHVNLNKHGQWVLVDELRAAGALIVEAPPAGVRHHGEVDRALAVMMPKEPADAELEHPSRGDPESRHARKADAQRAQQLADDAAQRQVAAEKGVYVLVTGVSAARAKCSKALTRDGREPDYHCDCCCDCCGQREPRSRRKHEAVSGALNV